MSARARLTDLREVVSCALHTRLTRLAAAIAAQPRSLRGVLLAAAVLHGLGISWGLPASDAWDNDGIAPRDILPGLAATFTPGDHFTYPPVHLALLALLTLPWTFAATLRAGSLRVPDVIHVILAPQYMTAFALAARLVSLAMSLGIALALGKIAEELTPGDRARKERALTLTAAIASSGVAFTYYAHTSNLDVPSLFWGTLAALGLVRAISRHEPERLRSVAVLVALSVGTKDQTYALFAVSAPLLFVGWFAFDEWPRRNVRRVAKESLYALAISAAVLAFVDGAVFNPSGFRARVAFLRGPASQDFSNYARGLEGTLAIVAELGKELPRHYPWAFAGFFVLGLVVALGRGRRVLAAALAPLVIAASFTIAFNIAARRTDDRFLLPQMLFFAVYGGIGMERVWSLDAPWARAGGRLIASAFFVLAVWEALRIDLTLLYEPRYRTEAFLEANVRPGDTIEVHGLNVYLPRFPAAARVIRVGPGPAARRGPLPGVEEVEDHYMNVEARKARFVVVSTCYAWRYLPIDTSSHDGHIYPPNQVREAHDVDATSFFGGLYDGRLGYRIVDDQKIRRGWFDPIEIHASLNCRTTTFAKAL